MKRSVETQTVSVKMHANRAYREPEAQNWSLTHDHLIITRVYTCACISE